MTVIALDRQFLTDYLNTLKPNSRYRAGVVDLLRRVNKLELEEQKVNRECVKALEEALSEPWEFMGVAYG